MLAIRIALAQLGSRKRQTLVTTLGVALGVGVFLAVGGLMNGFQTFFRTEIIEVNPHVIISDEYREAMDQPMRRLHPESAVAVRRVLPRDPARGVGDARRILEGLAAMPEVAAASPVLRGQLLLRRGGRDYAVSGIGIEPASAVGVSRLADDMVAGSLDSLTSVKDGVVIGDRLAERMNVAIGDTITAVAPSGQAARLRVVGRFRSSMEQVDRGQIYLSLPRQQALQNRPRVVNEIQIKMRDADEAIEAAAAMEARWGYKAVPWQEANERVLAVFVLQKAIIFSTVSAILVVASFGIFNIITTVVLEKSRDIAILRSIGLSRIDIVLIFGFQGLAVSLSGTLAGFVLGIGLAELMGMIPAPGATDPTQTLRIAQPAWLFAAAAGIGVLTSLIAAWLPAARAARADPLDIIRGAS